MARNTWKTWVSCRPSAGYRGLSSAWSTSCVAVVVEIDALCLAATAVPPEDEPPLIVDADRVEARQAAAQLHVIGSRPIPGRTRWSANGNHLTIDAVCGWAVKACPK